MVPKDGWIEVYDRFRGDEPAGGDPLHEGWRVDARAGRASLGAPSLLTD